MMKNTIKIMVLSGILLSCSSLSDKQVLSSYEKSIEKYRNKIHSDHLGDESPFRTEKEKSTFVGFDYYKTNEALNITAELTPFEQKDTLIMKTSTGKDRPFLKVGKLNFDIKGKQQLVLYKSIGDNSHYFLPFTDETSGNDSYGGGRYLDLEVGTMKNNLLPIDFNKAYNPYCAYVDGYSCPIPPAENHINVRIEGGVKYQKNVFKK